MDHHQIMRALKHGWPGVPITLRGTAIEGMAWGGSEAKPTRSEVEAAWAEIADAPKPEREPEPAPTDAERIAALEARLAALEAL